jgi:hypothetical protein
MIEAPCLSQVYLSLPFFAARFSHERNNVQYLLDTGRLELIPKANGEPMRKLLHSSFDILKQL